jgi:hypothetical protein
MSTAVGNVKITTQDGLTSKTGQLDDGTRVEFCHPCRRWEWNCKSCDQIESTRSTVCGNCGKSRKES